jgi:bifunctional UDP-N-acetylglucosamine pyrophosphorylase / glucosamine-1-phosphate N-acetyltransferase
MHAIVLAGGKGTRMKSPLPKVLHKICGKPMILYIIDTLRSLNGIEGIVVVVGYKRGLVRKTLPKGVKTAVQKQLLGTGDAVRSARPALKGYRGDVLILCGDTPLITEQTLSGIMESHIAGGNDVTAVTAVIDEPHGYGRIVRSAAGRMLGIVEEKDATAGQKKIREINTGVYVYGWPRLNAALDSIKKNRLKGEYYLTDAVGIFRKKGYRIGTYTVKDPGEMTGVDDAARLAKAEKYFMRRKHV